ncbi:hypothetical protein BXU06_11685 [Aquaspirillum sp. LM1]|uniref:methyl-accepting chemotaxis protein n=1 Tax=Aquaspirillum sp. LM1 TaxID=1938604 RepID=UPI0009838F46|nr:methyl-accepting chemotaxis protein [Aquaspirillum sp. LM1]AQR65637.1 hypothetical protein BXU06_11685 [Aquaspirillum sp. LM1]
MKLSLKLACIVLAAALGLLLLSAYSLYVLRDNMVEERKASVHMHLRMVANQIAQFQAAEKSGALNRDEAQKQAAQAIRALRHEGDYFFLRNTAGLSIVHPDKRKEGKTDGAGTLPDGRPTMQGYLDVLAKADFGYVPLMTKRPGGEVEVPKINGVIRIDGWDWILGTGVFLDDVDRVFWQRAGQFLLIGVAVLALVVGLAAWLAREIYRTLGGEPGYAAEVASRIASGNLSQPIHTERDDSLLGAMARMQGSLSAMVTTIQSGAAQLNQSALDINQEMQQMSEMAHASSEATLSTTAAIQQLSNSVLQISENAQQTQLHSSRASHLAEEGEVLVSDAAQCIGLVAHQLEQASGQIASLDKRASDIGGIANVIKDIADQTNLLALNAAIEAARAGEQGRGFAVVADEVRKLAERTTTATSQIAQMIQAVQDDTHHVVASMQTAAPQVDSSVNKARSAAQALQEIRAGASLALDNIRDVAHSTQEQSAANHSVADHIERIASMVETSASAARNAQHNAGRLEALAKELNQAVARFTV